MKPTSMYLAPVLLLCLAFVVHLPGRRKWRIPVVRSGYAVLLIGAVTLFHAQPPVIAEVNAFTGTANFSAPLVYALNTAFSGAVLGLVINWRGGDPVRAHRVWLHCVSVYSACAVLIVVLFVLGDAPVERLTDFDSYYANTPYIREMILLYLAAHSFAMITMLRLCVSWQREVSGMLRAGLLLVVIGAFLDIVGFQATKYISVVARWAGHDLDFLSTSVAPVAVSVAGLFVALGFIVPRASGQWEALIDHRALGVLWAAVRHVTPPLQPASPWWQLPAERLACRQTAIHDALLRLHPHFSEEVLGRARACALAEGRGPREAETLAEAAVVRDALASHAAELAPTNAAGTCELRATRESVYALVSLSRSLSHDFADPSLHTPAQSPSQA